MIRNILLVEDERGIALLLKTQLERQGYVVHAAGDGLQALDVLKAESVDLVVTDVVMPNMDGVDLYLELKNEPRTANLPIIIITDKQVFMDSFAALGVNHFLPKTSDVSLLIEKIKDIERRTVESRDYHKVLVCGEDRAVLNDIQMLLNKRECLVYSARNNLEIVSKAMEMKPHLILIDVMIQENTTAKELIRSLKCYGALSHAHILVYSHFLSEEVNQTPEFMESLEDAIKESLEAGADKYIGRFNRLTFLDQLKEFGIKPQNV